MKMDDYLVTLQTKIHRGTPYKNLPKNDKDIIRTFDWPAYFHLKFHDKDPTASLERTDDSPAIRKIRAALGQDLDEPQLYFLAYMVEAREKRAINPHRIKGQLIVNAVRQSGRYLLTVTEYGEIHMRGDPTRECVLKESPWKQVHTIQNPYKIVGGMEHILGMTWDGKLFGLGNNTFGQAGITYTTTYFARLPFFQNKTVEDVAAGPFHTVVLDDTNTVYTFGDNRHQQLGYETTEPHHKTPRKLNLDIGSHRIINVTAGSGWTKIHLSNGSVITYGQEDES